MTRPSFNRWPRLARHLSFAALAAISMDTAALEEPPGGREVYARCTGCHALDRNAMGPLHCGVVGRAAGAVPGFRYSTALLESGIVWTPDVLDAFLANPSATVPGTKMLYAGVPEAPARGALVAWLAWAAKHEPRCAAAGS